MKLGHLYLTPQQSPYSSHTDTSILSLTQGAHSACALGRPWAAPMETMFQRLMVLTIVAVGFVFGGCVRTQEGASKNLGGKQEPIVAAAGMNSPSSKPGTVKYSKEAGGYTVTVEVGGQKRLTDSNTLAKAIPPDASITFGEQPVRMPVKLSNPKYDPGSGTLTYTLEPLQGETARTLPPNGGSVQFSASCPDGIVSCYGGSQCNGDECCAVDCGPLDLTVGYCWSWGNIGCQPCQDYSDQCNKEICNSDNPNPLFGCRQGECSSSRSCVDE